jgi:glycosyltransferase involved in cell wall biosynthesis
MKLVAMLMAYNERETGHLIRCLASLEKYCDAIVIYDDASTDDSQSIYRLYEAHVIQGTKNDFKNELAHKQQQLELCKKIGADWILRIDADETLDERGIQNIRSMLENASAPTFAFHTINLWRSPCFYRVDGSYNEVIFNRLWRCKPDLHFNVQNGLHLTNYPVGATDNEAFAPYEIIHWGFASDKYILDKYNMYKSHGQTGLLLNRLVDEKTLVVKRSKKDWFRDELPPDQFNQVFDKPLVSLL